MPLVVTALAPWWTALWFGHIPLRAPARHPSLPNPGSMSRWLFKQTATQQRSISMTNLWAAPNRWTWTDMLLVGWLSLTDIKTLSTSRIWKSNLIESETFEIKNKCEWIIIQLFLVLINYRIIICETTNIQRKSSSNSVIYIADACDIKYLCIL